MPEPVIPHDGITTLPPLSANGSARPPPALQRRGRPTRIASIRMGLIAGFGALILLVIFIIQNTHAMHISFLGAHASLSLAVALLIAAIAGALAMAAAGTARITQLRRTTRRAQRSAGPGAQAPVPASGTRRDRQTGPGTPPDQASVMSRPPANPPFGQAPAGEAVATLIPRGSTSTVGIPAGGAASIRAAIPPGRHQRKSASTTPAAGPARPMEAGGHTPAAHLPSCLALSRR